MMRTERIMEMKMTRMENMGLHHVDLRGGKSVALVNWPISSYLTTRINPTPGVGVKNLLLPLLVPTATATAAEAPTPSKGRTKPQPVLSVSPEGVHATL
jgi:hypothetical protein